MLDQVEERRLPPLNVVEGDDERAVERGVLERPADIPRDLRRRRPLAEDRLDRRAELLDRKSTRLNSSHSRKSRMPSSA